MIGAVVSPNTGIEYDVKLETVIDACRKCEGSGKYHYSTFADYRELVKEQWAFEADESPYKDDDLYPYDAAKSASCECDRCHGTGIVKGEGAVHKFKITASCSIQGMP